MKTSDESPKMPALKVPMRTAIELFDDVFHPEEDKLFEPEFFWQTLNVSQLETVVRSALREFGAEVDRQYEETLAEHRAQIKRRRARSPLWHAVAVLWDKDIPELNYPSEQQMFEHLFEDAFSLVIRLEGLCDLAGVHHGRLWNEVRAFRQRMMEVKSNLIARRNGRPVRRKFVETDSDAQT